MEVTFIALLSTVEGQVKVSVSFHCQVRSNTIRFLTVIMSILGAVILVQNQKQWGVSQGATSLRSNN